MKKPLLLVPAVLILLLTGCQKEDFSERFPPGGKLEILVSPSYFIQSDPLRGMEIDLARTLAKRMQQEAQFRQVPFENLLRDLRSGEGQIALSSLEAIPERKKGLSFSEPYSERRLLLLAKPGPDFVAARAYSKTEEAAQSMSGYRLISTQSTRESLSLLREGRVSRAWIEEELFEPGPWRIIEKKKIGLGYSIATNDSLLAEEINRQLEIMRKNGQLDRILSKYLPR